MNRLAGFIYDHAKQIIALVIILNLVSLASFFRFDLNTDFLGFFSEENPKAEEYHHLNAKYERMLQRILSRLLKSCVRRKRT